MYRRSSIRCFAWSSPLRLAPLAAALTAAVALALAATLLAAPAAASPDLSQYSDPGWLYYCAPTAAADIVYEFGFGGLSGDVPAADAIVADLASNMSTNVGLNGTSHTNLRDGLDLYLETASGDPGGSAWNTNLFLTASQPGGGNDIWSIVTSALSAGAGVVMIVDWPNQAPTQQGGGESYEDPQTAGQISHAISLTGFTPGVTETLSFRDPGNNNTHLFPPTTPDSSPISRDATKMEISSFPGGGSTPVVGNVVGVVTTVPEAGTGLLLLVGLGLALRFYRS